MNEFFIYLLKVSAGLGIVILPYCFFFRNDPNLVMKRLYLLSGLVAVWIFPLITFRRPEMFVNLAPTVIIDPNTTEFQHVDMNGSVYSPGITINWIRLLIITYLTGMVFLFLKNLFIVIKWNLIWRKTRNDKGVAFHTNDQVFTLFTRIFIPGSLKNNQDLDSILLHEKAHIQQLHFIDLMLMELALLLTWFNPFSWLISRMIKENHEHLADRKVLSEGVNPARYRAQLLNHTLGVNVFRLGNQFNHSLTLKRFNMMKKPLKSPIGIMKIALMIPVVLVILGLTTGLTPQQKSIKGKVVFADTGEPAVGASVIIRGTTMGTITDDEGAFAINMDADQELVISFVGYSTIFFKASKVPKEPLKLEPKVFEVDLESVPFAINKTAFTVRFTDDLDKKPVFVLDGEVMKDYESIDPESIEKVEVFKDPDSEIVKKYKAKDGVILITLKDKQAISEKEENEEMKLGDEVFYIVEDMPKFPGGKAALKTYIYSNLKVPESVIKESTSEEVLVQFLVTTAGKLDQIKVAQSSNKEFNKPALDVFKGMPDWSPGKQRGIPVQVQVVVPVKFPPDME